MTQAPARNAPCPCGSGKKYKHCCGAAGQPQAAPTAQQLFTNGVQLLRARQPAAAMPVLLSAIQAGATHFEAYHALGTALIENGRFADASSILTHAVSLKPDSATAFWDLGAAFDHQTLHEQAIAAYRQAVTLNPRLAKVQLRLAQIYTMYSRNTEAANCLDRAADADPKSTEARLYRSDAALLRGDIAAAEDWARKAVALAPANAAAQGGLAGVLYSQGRFAEAEAGFEAALSLEPRAGKSWQGLAQCRKYTPADAPVLQRMATVLQHTGLPEAERTTIHFAMGKILEDCGDYANAMQHFDAANALRAKTLAFDRPGLTALVDRAIARFTPAFFARHAASASHDETPLFITGMYRSGTTLVEQILSSHPQIAARGELTVWGPAEMELEPATGDLNTEQTAASVAKYLAVLRQIGPGAVRVTDKLPTNLFRLGAIHAALPRARIIHCKRDPIDTCLSIYTTNFATNLPFAASKRDLEFHYRQYARIMAHWRAVLPPEIFLEVEYENLIANRAPETRRLVDFAGVQWDETCLHPDRNARPIGTASAWQARQPVYTTSVKRWRRYEAWAKDLLDLQNL